MKRCINIDWLELHAYEPVMGTLNAAYFRRKGYHVEEREYGTRVYREMFTLLDSHGFGMIEIRRNPYSQGLTGIHQFNECHIRLTNRTCYWDNAAEMLNKFVSKHQYYNVRISRIDLCYDFSVFDKGDDPAAFVRRYLKHKYAKINQGRIHAHGADTWSGQEWNSLAWGAKTSPVYTKMYNKTMELYNAKFNVYEKPYIRHAWFLCGLIDDIDRCTLKGEEVQVWRVEFSLTSAVKNWVAIELNGETKHYQSLRNDLDVYNSREKILLMFASLSRHYFRFKYYEEGKRKDRCKDKILFDFKEVEETYKVGRPDYTLSNGNPLFSKWQRLLTLLEPFRPNLSSADERQAFDIVVSAIKDEIMRSNLVNPYSRKDLEILKQLLCVRINHPEYSWQFAFNEVKKLLNLNDNTLPVV